MTVKRYTIAAATLAALTVGAWLAVPAAAETGNAAAAMGCTAAAIGGAIAAMLASLAAIETHVKRESE